MEGIRLNVLLKNMLQYPPESNSRRVLKGEKMDIGENLILTGWGYVEYVVAAAVALKALNGNAAVYGVSRRRLPELIGELSDRRGDRGSGSRSCRRIYLIGISLIGDPKQLAAGLSKLKAKGVKVTWISALAMPEEAKEHLDGLMETKVYDASLVEAVGQAFSRDVKEFMPYLKGSAKTIADVRDYFAFIEAAQFYYRNYQDEELYAKAVRYISNGVRPAAWDAATKDSIAHYERYGNRELIGKSDVMKALQERINRVAKRDRARVLILGESGTGKETVANQIHNKSPRANMPFVPFNCASVNKDLLEDRFFGHEKGAFTNAVERTDGLFLQADGGTLFLDEIGEMSLEVQALLLRVLEGGRFMRVGGSEEIKCDVRLVTATNSDLARLVAEGRFREDLYQRLNVVQLRTPSLREHKEDIPAIANAWWRKVHDNKVLGQEQIAALMDYDYPGNVRELVNILDRATALEEDDFGELMREHREMNAALTRGVEQRTDSQPPDRLDDAIRLHVRRVYDKCGQNLSRAAEALDVSRNTVRKYLSGS